MKILVIDDSRVMVQIITKALKNCGYSEVISFQNPIEAINYLANSNDIGVILCDWNMPGMTGMEILKEIKNTPHISEIPFFMVTSRGGKKDLMTALKAGVNNYIVKPIQEDDLRQKLLNLKKDEK